MNDEDFAIVVGIDKYPGLAARYSLKTAEAGAKGFSEWLVHPERGALPEGNVVKLLFSELEEPRPAEPYPMKHHVDRALVSLLTRERGRIGRRLYFYFGGHGLGSSFDEVALLMADATRYLLSNIGIHLYQEHLRHAAPFDELVFFLDCCREFADRVVPGPPLFRKITDQDRAPNVRSMVAHATKFGKEAFGPEVPTDQGRGLFTQALLEGLHGKAIEPDGRITGDSLRDYLKLQVPALAETVGRKQEPDVVGTRYEEIILCTVDAPQTLRVQLQIPAVWRGELILFNGDLQELAHRPPGGGSWEIELARGLYKLRHVDGGQEHLFGVDDGEEPIHVAIA